VIYHFIIARLATTQIATLRKRCSLSVYLVVDVHGGKTKDISAHILNAVERSIFTSSLQLKMYHINPYSVL